MPQNGATQSSASTDIFDIWRQFYESNEQAWTKVVKEMITSQGYAETQGKMLENVLSLQKMMRDSMTTQLHNINVPTRDDVARLGELILSLEEKIDRLDERIAGLGDRVVSVEGKISQVNRPASVAHETPLPQQTVGRRNGHPRPKVGGRSSESRVLGRREKPAEPG